MRGPVAGVRGGRGWPGRGWPVAGVGPNHHIVLFKIDILKVGVFMP
jgi:hypothetical protein